MDQHFKTAPLEQNVSTCTEANQIYTRTHAHTRFCAPLHPYHILPLFPSSARPPPSCFLLLMHRFPLCLHSSVCGTTTSTAHRHMRCFPTTSTCTALPPTSSRCVVAQVFVNANLNTLLSSLFSLDNVQKTEAPPPKHTYTLRVNNNCSQALTLLLLFWLNRCALCCCCSTTFCGLHSVVCGAFVRQRATWRATAST